MLVHIRSSRLGPKLKASHTTLLAPPTSRELEGAQGKHADGAFIFQIFFFTFVIEKTKIRRGGVRKADRGLTKLVAPTERLPMVHQCGWPLAGRVMHSPGPEGKVKGLWNQDQSEFGESGQCHAITPTVDRVQVSSFHTVTYIPLD